HLSEELAPTERRTLLPIHDDPCLAIEDDKETRSRQALPEDALPFGEPTLLEDVGNLLELWRLEVGEQGEAGERIDDLVRRCHPSSASRWSPRAPAGIPRGAVPSRPSVCHRIRSYRPVRARSRGRCPPGGGIGEDDGPGP